MATRVSCHGRSGGRLPPACAWNSEPEMYWPAASSSGSLRPENLTSASASSCTRDDTSCRVTSISFLGILGPREPSPLPMMASKPLFGFSLRWTGSHFLCSSKNFFLCSSSITPSFSSCFLSFPIFEAIALSRFSRSSFVTSLLRDSWAFLGTFASLRFRHLTPPPMLDRSAISCRRQSWPGSSFLGGASSHIAFEKALGTLHCRGHHSLPGRSAISVRWWPSGQARSRKRRAMSKCAVKQTITKTQAMTTVAGL
mmetsp:Transcript_29018/g.75983  ORF Transcript_29018/g.75983 Transcript_29018/m.75983 type:complete len:255 (-) Transcript_29018:376-1140(-)